jgi:hypothetical protein
MISDPLNVATFAHRPAGGDCAPTGVDSVNANVLDWLSQIERAFPQSAPESQQIVIATGAGVTDVTVTICWPDPNGGEQRRLTVRNRVQR